MRDMRTDRADSGGGEKGARADLGAGIVQETSPVTPITVKRMGSGNCWE